ncbi:MAG: hypothetical protein JHD28_02150 [Bacteroidia bacterium]|nr:hypothetical protein [Bacteroidia bacterium]
MFVLLSFLALVLYNEHRSKKLVDDIKKHPKIVTAIITDWKSIKYNYSIIVKFKFRDKIIEKDFSTPTSRCKEVGRLVSVILDSTNAENAHLLLLPKDYSKFDLSFPDSMSWTKTCFEID